jgi:uncharacterized membrane protein/thiol-disulfide isomerase/thioredoxin
VRRLIWRFIILLIISWLLVPSGAIAQTPGGPVVRAILFYSPTCPHCHKVITEVLIPMVESYGSDQLQIVGIDTSQAAGGQLYQATIERYEIPPSRAGVPTLVIGDVVLVGSVEIPEMFPDLVERGLEEDGIDWPDIPGLAEVIPPKAEEDATPDTPSQPSATSAPPSESSATPASTSTAEAEATSVPTSSAAPTETAPTRTPALPDLTLGGEEVPVIENQNPPPDPVGFALASAVLLGIVIAVAYVAWRLVIAWPDLFQLDRNPPHTAQSWAIPILALLGLGVAAYLAYVEITHVEAVCGPVGKCNIVQSSPYAQILGIPIAVLGLLNYLAVVVLWTGQKLPAARWANVSALALLGLSLFGTFFSIYLTCLELFAIHAICAWCLSSAVITTLLMLLSAIPITSRASPKLGA